MALSSPAREWPAPHSRLSFPLTWGGDKHAAAQLEKSFDGNRGVFGTRGC